MFRFVLDVCQSSVLITEIDQYSIICFICKVNILISIVINLWAVCLIKINKIVHLNACCMKKREKYIYIELKKVNCIYCTSCNLNKVKGKNKEPLLFELQYSVLDHKKCICKLNKRPMTDTISHFCSFKRVYTFKAFYQSRETI